jgi:cyanate permease
MGVFVTVMNAGLLVSSFAVAPLISWLGAQYVVIWPLACFAYLGALLFVVNPIRDVASETEAPTTAEAV